MDASKFTPSQNVEDFRSDPWRYLYSAYPYLGLTRAPTDVLRDLATALMNPAGWFQQSGPQYNMTPSARGSMADLLGRNDFLRLLQQQQSGTNPGATPPSPNGLLGGMFDN